MIVYSGRVGMQRRLLMAWVFFFVGIASQAFADTGRLDGVLRTEAGEAVADAQITVRAASGPMSVTVTTNDAGVFAVDDIDIFQPLDLAVKKMGIAEIEKERVVKKSENGYRVELVAREFLGLSNQVPASFWMTELPDDSSGHLVMLNCVNCHQMPNERVRSFTEKTEGLPMDAKRLAWAAVVKHMRIKMFTIAPEADRVDIRSIPQDFYSEDSKYSPWNRRDGELMADALAKAMPTSFTGRVLADGVTQRKVKATIGRALIREFRLPGGPDGRAMYHDSLAGRSATGDDPVAWTVDWHNAKMYEVNRNSGLISEIPLGDAQKGPHTIVPDVDGNLWVTFQTSNTIGRWDPRLKEWENFNIGDNAKLAANAGGQGFLGVSGNGDPMLVHSFANNSSFQLTPDATGRVWASLSGVNRIVALNPKTGRTDIYDGPSAPDDSPVSAGMYQGAMTSSGRHVWFSQLGAAQVFRFDVSRNEVDKIIKFERGSGPRRLTISDKDILYIPLQGSGELAAYDGNSGELIARYSLPDRHCATYTSTWDTGRQVVWAPCSNSDQIYAFDPGTEKFTAYPLPRRAPLIRAISVDPVDGDLVFTYAPVADLKPNNLLVVMRPEK